MERNLSVLSRPAILRHLQAGNIVIHRFDLRKLRTVSYDVSLGEWCWREAFPHAGLGFYNFYDFTRVQEVWDGPYRAEEVAQVVRRTGLDLGRNISPHDKVILIGPGETLLCHTEEFIGGRNCVTTQMRARSSAGRNFLEVCKCAGWGDVGYINRWVMEVTNNSRYYFLPLVVGRRLAQITFFEVEPLDEDYLELGGKYQTERDLEVLVASWSPEIMLPRMDRDFEVLERGDDERKHSGFDGRGKNRP